MIKKRQLFDIAANLTDDQFYGIYHHKHYHEKDVLQVMKRSTDVGCDHLLIASGCLGDVHKAIELCKLSDKYYTTAGIHPCRAAELTKGDPYKYLADLRIQMDIAHKQNKLIVNNYNIQAIGECGLDYDRLQWSSKEQQRMAFLPHFQWAQEYKLPLYLHNRNTGNDFYDILQENKPFSGVVHSFTGTAEELEKILHFNLYVGVNGCSLKSKENIDNVKRIPIDKLLLETDAPYCEIRNTHESMKYVKTQFQAKQPDKFKEGMLIKGRNEPCKIVQVLEVVSELIQMDPDKLAEIVFQNTMKCFNL